MLLGRVRLFFQVFCRVVGILQGSEGKFEEGSGGRFPKARLILACNQLDRRELVFILDGKLLCLL